MQVGKSAYGQSLDICCARFRYTGQILLPGSALYHYKERVYHPNIGRFLQTDLIGEAKRDEQGGESANGCRTDIDSSNSAGHHIERHADGGQSVPENHAEVCKDCHNELHSGNK